jgi:hypothetical protein
MTRHYQSRRKHDFEESAAYAAAYLAGAATQASSQTTDQHAVSDVTP